MFRRHVVGRPARRRAQRPARGRNLPTRTATALQCRPSTGRGVSCAPRDRRARVIIRDQRSFRRSNGADQRTSGTVRGVEGRRRSYKERGEWPAHALRPAWGRRGPKANAACAPRWSTPMAMTNWALNPRPREAPMTSDSTTPRRAETGGRRRRFRTPATPCEREVVGQPRRGRRPGYKIDRVEDEDGADRRRNTIAPVRGPTVPGRGPSDTYQEPGERVTKLVDEDEDQGDLSAKAKDRCGRDLPGPGPQIHALTACKRSPYRWSIEPTARRTAVGWNRVIRPRRSRRWRRTRSSGSRRRGAGCSRRATKSSISARATRASRPIR